MNIHIIEDETVCANCKHYRGHFVRWAEYADGYYQTNCGHCVYPRIKHRHPGNEACYNFEKTI